MCGIRSSVYSGMYAHIAAREEFWVSPSVALPSGIFGLSPSLELKLDFLDRG